MVQLYHKIAKKIVNSLKSDLFFYLKYNYIRFKLLLSNL
jgi:hypothetical protein